MGKPNPAVIFKIGMEGVLFNGLMREAREDNFLTLKGLAAKVGVPTHVVVDIEYLRLVPEATLARRIADVLEMEVDFLFPAGIEHFQKAGTVELVATATEWSEALRLGEPSQVASLNACCLFSSTDPCEIVVQRDERRRFNLRWSNLPLLQKVAVGLYCGIIGGAHHSFEQIALMLGCSETRAKVHVGTGLYNLNPLEVPDD